MTLRIFSLNHSFKAVVDQGAPIYSSVPPLLPEMGVGMDESDGLYRTSGISSTHGLYGEHLNKPNWLEPPNDVS